MTNAATPGTPGTPAPKSGMPTWVKILLAILLVIVLGCCGIFGTCYYFVNKGVQTVKEHAPEWQKQMEEAAEKARAEAEKQAAEEAKKSSDGERFAPSATPDEAVKAVKMPANFPTDLPRYAGMVPTWASSDKTTGSGQVIFKVAANVDTITAYYEKEMVKNGWSETSNNSVNDTWIGIYKKGGRSATVTATPEGKQTQVTIIYTRE